FLPLRDAAAVTTTQLTVTPGDIALIEGSDLVVRAAVQRLARGGGTGPTLHVCQRDAATWTTLPMSAESGGVFAARVPDVRKELDYFVTAGDATGRAFRARTITRPALAELRVRYHYPAYLNAPDRE